MATGSLPSQVSIPLGFRPAAGAPELVVLRSRRWRGFVFVSSRRLSFSAGYPASGAAGAIATTAPSGPDVNRDEAGYGPRAPPPVITVVEFIHEAAEAG
jgi:hypothetical protein